MKLISLTMSGYRQFADEASLLFPEGVTGICGPNGVGKSKIIEAIGFALYGPNKRILPAVDKKDDLASKGRAGSRPRVDLVIEVGGVHYQITRTDRTAKIVEVASGAELADTPTGVTTRVIELLGLTPQAYLGTFVARQNHISLLQTLQDKERMDLINRLIGITEAERAQTIANAELSKQQEALKIAKSSIRKTLEEATSDMGKAEEDARHARAEEERLREERNACRIALEQARSCREELRAAAQEEASLKKQLESLLELRQTLTENRSKAVTTLATAEQAERDIAVERGYIAQLSTVQARLSRLAGLARIAELTAERDRIKKDLSTRIALGKKALEDIDSAIDRLDREIADANNALTECTGTLGSAKAEMEQEEKAANHLCGHRLTAQKLGPDGACETCGQRFGTNLPVAVANYEREEQEARGRAARARTRMSDARREVQRLERVKSEASIKRTAYLAKRPDYANFPGEEAQTARRLAEIANELATFEVALQITAYSEQEHEAVRQDLARIEKAQSLLAGLEEKIVAGEGVADEIAFLDGRLAELEGEQRTLQKGQRVAQEALDGLDAADRAVGDAETAEKAAQAGWEHAYRVAADAAAAEAKAAEVLAEAVKQDEAVKAAERALTIAEYVSRGMDRMVQEITQEARPILCDYMGEWAHSLLGPRFRKITLTPEYRIMADTGYGEHRIEHYSGGEQTLLALMLRVAISLFCHQRTTFDKGFLILDEIFGNQDAEHRVMLLRFLDTIRADYHQVLIVNHVEDVSDAFDNIIDVARTDSDTNISTALLRTVR